MSKHVRGAAIPVAPSLNGYARKRVTTVTASRPVSKRVFMLSLQAVGNAIVVGIIAKALVLLISLFTNIAFYGKFSFAESSPAGHHLGWMVVLVPIAGSILVGIMARFGSEAIRGHGIPEAMEKIILNESKIPPIITFLKPLSAAISIGTGGPFGAEGPIIATGGAFGSVTGQIMRISAAERKIMLAAGACAGMSAIFGSPLAAVLLAIELLLFEFSPRSIIPVALSCVTGAAMHLLLFGSEPVFAMPVIPAPSGTALVTYVVLGAVIGVIAAGVSKSVYSVEDAFEKLPVHWMWWPALGACVVGVVGYFAPATMGVGYDNIRQLLSGNLPLTMLLSLCLLKYLSWVIALGSGTSGGTLAPLFTIGGALGACLGVAVLTWLPGTGINIATAALIGMAAMFAGASRALLTSIVFALETTAQPEGLLPLLGACTAAYFVSFFLMKGSIMTEKIRRRGIRTPEVYEPDVLLSLTAGSVAVSPFLKINEMATVADVKALLEKEGVPGHQYIIVTDAANKLAGYLNLAQLQQQEGSIQHLLLKKAPFVYHSDDVATASVLMGRYGTDVLAVVRNHNEKEVTGMVRAMDILKAYSTQKRRDELYHSAMYSDRKILRWVALGRRLIRVK
jgi:H+/Cl- antiporter ClcA/CBS domain-containing protein